MAGNRDEKANKVVIRDKDMKAYLTIYPKAEGGDYTKQELLDLLGRNNVKEGINESRIAAMIKKHIYKKEVLVAEGKPSVDGVDGYIEYLFPLKEKKKKPALRDDGSVDYTSVNVIHSVNEGDKLAVYHPSVTGSPGLSVKGKVIAPRRARELKPLMTKGCEYIEEEMTYYATVNGRVDVSGSRMSVANMQEFKHDIDSVFGNVSFKGDVIIHGNVKPGVVISATKSVTIDGLLQGSDIIAGGDIIIKGGVLGNETTRISCGGDLFAEFIEYADINVKGSVSANVFMNCKAMVNGYVHATGKLGTIVGGTVYGMAGVDAMFVGNDVFLKTVVQTGVSEEIRKAHARYNREVKEIMDKMAEIQREADEVQKEIRLGNDDDYTIKRKQQLMQDKIKQDTILSEVNQYIKEMEDNIAETDNSSIEISDTCYPGSVIILDEQQLVIDEEKRQVEFIRDSSGNLIPHAMLVY